MSVLYNEFWQVFARPASIEFLEGGKIVGTIYDTGAYTLCPEMLSNPSVVIFNRIMIKQHEMAGIAKKMADENEALKAEIESLKQRLANSAVDTSEMFKSE